MAFKFEIVGNALVITNTVTTKIVLDEPAKDLYINSDFLRDHVKVSIYDTNHTHKHSGAQKFSAHLADCVDASLTVFTDATVRDFARTNLSTGNTGGSFAAAFKFTAANYTALAAITLPAPQEGDLAIVYNSQGVWLINRKLKGVYMYQSGVWEYANQELQDFLEDKVDSVTGDGVDNTDPLNPALTFPTPAEIGAKPDFIENSAFNKNFGTSAGEVLEGDTTTITPTQSADITTNNAKVSFPEAPSDGKQYARKDAGWEEVSTGVAVQKIACCPFGAKSDSLGKFLIANGKSTDADDSTKPKTRQPIAFDGTLKKLAYKTKDGSTSTQMKIHVNGSVEQTVVLSSMNANDGGVETISVSVTAGDYVEIEYDSSQKPGECTMYFIQELS